MNTLFILLILIESSLSILDRTYYKALNISISAGPEQIKQSFKKLSRKYHPDRNPNSRQKFQKINKAYETLSNQHRKYLYDRLGSDKMNNPNIQQQKDIALLKGSDMNIKLLLKLEDLYQGKQIIATIFKQTVCSHCLGTGAQNKYDIAKCNDCQGQGRTSKKVHVGGGFYNMVTETCQRCQGKGKIIGRKCSTCSGIRIVSGSEQFKIPIQPGTLSGEQKRYINMGDQLEQGAPADVVIKFFQAAHPQYRREGNLLRTQISITLKEALFGFTRTIKQLDGRELLIQRKEITQPRQLIIIQGEGMPIKNTNMKGNMIVQVNVTIPQYTPTNIQKLKNVFTKIVI